jgi:predicted component of type VI protein secretion system
MESAWRGLRLLLQQDGDRSAFKVELASVQSETLDRVLENLTPHVTASPPALVVVDLPFDNTPLAIERLTACARWAAEMMLPVIAWAPAEMMLIDGWDKLSTLPYLPHHLQEAAHAKLRSLREAPEGHWLCLTCNRFLLRYPYGPDNTPRKVAVSEQEPLWISPVWGLAALIAQSVAQTGWPTRFTDRGQFRIQDLALHSVGRAGQLPAEMCPDADRRDQFIRSGFTPLAVETGRDTAFFPAAVMLSGTPLPYQLLVCQVSQFLLQCKELLPAENDPAALETQLRLAFQIFSERSNPPGLAEVQISAGAPDTNGKMALRVQLTPHASVLKSRQPIELAFSW